MDNKKKEEYRTGAFKAHRRKQAAEARAPSSEDEALANAYQDGAFRGTFRDLPKGARDVLAQRGW